MQQTKNIKPLFTWAIKNGESKIVDRILVKTLPQFLKAHCTITMDAIQTAHIISVPSELYDIVKNMAEELIGSSYQE